MVIPMTMDCMRICLADLPLPPAAHQTTFNEHFMIKIFIQCATMIMKASSLMFNLLMGVFRIGPYSLGYVSGLVLLFFRADFAGLIALYLSLS